MKRTALATLRHHSLAAALAVLLSSHAFCADAPTLAPAPPKLKREWFPFHGEVTAVNKSANVISLKKQGGDRQIRLDPKSDLLKGGKAASLADVKPGDYVHGKLHKDATGNEVIESANIQAGPTK